MATNMGMARLSPMSCRDGNCFVTDIQRLIWRKSDGHLFEDGWILRWCELIEDRAFHSARIFHRTTPGVSLARSPLRHRHPPALRNMLFNVHSRFLIDTPYCGERHVIDFPPGSLATTWPLLAARASPSDPLERPASLPSSLGVGS